MKPHSKRADVVKRVAQIVSGLALAGLILPAVAFFLGWVEWETSNRVLLAATILWFASAPLSLVHGNNKPGQ